MNGYLADVAVKNLLGQAYIADQGGYHYLLLNLTFSRFSAAPLDKRNSFARKVWQLLLRQLRDTSQRIYTRKLHKYPDRRISRWLCCQH